MLGHHPLLERELRKKGRQAFAKVLESQRTHYTETVGSEAVVSNTDILWKLLLRVEPDGEPPFDAKVDALFPQMFRPKPGAEFAFAVLYDPNDHSKVVLDRSEEGYKSLDELLSKQRADARVGRMRARGQEVWADRYQAAHDSLVQYRKTEALSSDPDERRQQLEEQRAKMKQIMGAMGKPADALVGGQPAQTGGAPGPAATADALTKLADLRDRGVLTDAEFQAQKHKLLAD